MPDFPSASPNPDKQLLSDDQFDRAVGQMAETNRFGMVVMDDQGRVVWCNREFTETFGYTREEALGEAMLTRLFGPDLTGGDIVALAQSRAASRP